MKKAIMLALAALMICVCALASAQSYSLGDEADEIATIQTALKQLKLYTGEITGHFGAKTEAAVMAFQKKYALTDDGIAGEATIKALYEAADITADSASAASSGTALRHGSRSEAVRQLQQDLKTLGYYNGTVSGHYGSLTEAAVMAFQKANSLSADGIAGAKTLAKVATALSRNDNKQEEDNNKQDPDNGSSSLLKYGMKSEAVRTLQQNLKTLGYYSGSVTGNFGRLTKEAVYTFQKANGLSADGIAGAKTLTKISSKLSGNNNQNDNQNDNKNDNQNNNQDNNTNKLDTSRTLMLGTKDDEVRKMQRMLTTLGYYSGNVTGNFGEKTRDAVIGYQKAKGLYADGIAGKKTLAAINSDYERGIGREDKDDDNGGNLTDKAGKVLYANFYSWRRNYDNGEYCEVYDFKSGLSWTLRIMTKDAHMDAEPATAEDTAVMNRAFGGEVTWTPKVVWVTFSDGKTYIGSTHNVPHTPYHLKDNNFDGHLCVHFPIPMETAQKIGPYATSHQEAINEGWEATKKLQY
ncbi:MAG: peptidoglycan-binding protein [Clostridia bacterium]|nr:peptidoglycan-binding protein [Clostridia bacterium]